LPSVGIEKLRFIHKIIGRFKERVNQ